LIMRQGDRSEVKTRPTRATKASDLSQ
jgi:hypothetical protein